MKDKNVSRSGIKDFSIKKQKTKAPYCILLVDDDADICRLNSEVLIDHGYHVNSVGDGESAWQAMSMIHYDLVVTDNKMPRLTGVGLLWKIHREKVTVPVIMATGSLPSSEFDICPELKPSTILLKPYSISDLLLAVKQVLHGGDGGLKSGVPFVSP